MIIAIAHYAEIALKKKRRTYFETRLVQNIRENFRVHNIKSRIKAKDTRILCEIETDDKKIVTQVLKNTFGIKYFGLAQKIENDIEKIVSCATTIIQEMSGKLGLVTKRSYKEFPYTSLDINKRIGEVATKNNIKIDFKNNDKTIYTEVTSKYTYMYDEKIKGFGGLPLGSAGKVLSMLSGGIDSPVASFLMMKRGCRVDFVHFHTFRNNEDVLKTKIKELTDQLKKYQLHSKLILIPYYHYELMLQQHIRAKFDVVLFRNYMFKVVEKLCQKYKYKGIVTGDNLSQVASQTLQNMYASNEGLTIPIYRPLLTYDKDDIKNKAKEIGTYKISIKKYKDCCSIVSRKPATAVSTEKMREHLAKIPIEQVIDLTLNDVKIVII